VEDDGDEFGLVRGMIGEFLLLFLLFLLFLGVDGVDGVGVVAVDVVMIFFYIGIQIVMIAP